jgi:hypothetical protein
MKSIATPMEKLFAWIDTTDSSPLAKIATKLAYTALGQLRETEVWVTELEGKIVQLEKHNKEHWKW